MFPVNATPRQEPEPTVQLPALPKPAVSSGKRIFKNTLMLYVRLILSMGVSLYTVRIVLGALGVQDYGIYNVVGGVVALLSCLPGSMASATQRFFSFALGQQDGDKLKKIFTVNWVIYGSIAILALISLETVGYWFVSELLRVPAERYETVLNLYHLSVLTFAVGILTSPFMAIIIAHEDMHIYAYMAICESLLKLGSVFLLLYLPGDKLELYGLLVLLVAVLNASAYIGISVRRYDECQFRRFYWDHALLRELVGFTGWTLFGQITTVARNQAVTILLNQTFNPVVVAARAVATSITSRVNVFSTNFNVGLYPPIVKAFAGGNREQMHGLIFAGSKITFFLMWLFALPLFAEMDAIIGLWLMEPPDGSVLFARLALVEALINSVSLPLMTAARAPGKIAMYEVVLGSIQMAIFLVSWLVLTMGAAPHSVFVVAIIANVVMFAFRFAIVRGLIGISAKAFFKKVIVPAAGVALLSSATSYMVRNQLPGGLPSVGLSVLASLFFSCVCIYFLGLDREWREKLLSMVKRQILRVA